MPNEHIASIFGISSSVVVFIVVTSICFTLSLSSITNSNSTRCGNEEPEFMPKYFPNMAMFIAMTIGIVAMVALIFKRDKLTTEGHECRLTRRHNLHSTLSLRSIILFYVMTSTLDLNYLIVAVGCSHRWMHCDYYELEVILDNVSEVLYRIACFIFGSCETIVCWVMQPRKFKQSQWVWHGLAIIQAANISIWFNSVLNEASHRDSGDMNNFTSYFCFCNTSNVTDKDVWCSDESMAPKWFIQSSPFLFPITIEFALLVSETLLDRIIGGEWHNANQPEAPTNLPNSDYSSYFNWILYRPIAYMSSYFQRPRDDNDIEERSPVLNEIENVPGDTISCWGKLFVLMSLIVNIVYLVFTFLLLFGVPESNEWQTYADAFTVLSVVYDLFLIIGCAVGIRSCRRFRRPYSHTSFLEYLLLFATSGVVLDAIKRLVYFTSYPSNSWNFAYYLAACFDLLQSTFQIIFYYIAKDTKLQLVNNGGQADDSFDVASFHAVLIIISVSNFVYWISDSFVLPEIQQSITPTKYFIPKWPAFDNVVIPMTIFFRFNSALLFWCIGTDFLQPGELHED